LTAFRLKWQREEEGETVSESSDTEQASVVFMGRESFRMKVVGTPAGATNVGAIPNAIWEGPTARLVERRSSDRRNSERRKALLVPPPQGDPVELPGSDLPGPMPVPVRNLIIGVALTTFACGLLVATAVGRIRAHRDADVPAPIQHAQVVTAPVVPLPAAAQATTAAPPTPAAQAMPAVQPTAPAPAVVVQPLPAPEPMPAIAVEPLNAPTAVDARPEPRMATNAAPVPRPATPAVTRARRPAPAPHPASTPATQPDPFADPFPPAAEKPAARAKKWVDPFAE
jgi:hypothetical protein